MVLADTPQHKKRLAADYAEAIVDGGVWPAPVEFSQLDIMEAHGWTQADYESTDQWLIDMAEARLRGRTEGQARKTDRATARSGAAGSNPAEQLLNAQKRRREQN